MEELGQTGTPETRALRSSSPHEVPELIEGREGVISFNGTQADRLSPAVAPTQEGRRQAIEEIRALACEAKPLPEGVTIKGLFAEGRV